MAADAVNDNLPQEAEPSAYSDLNDVKPIPKEMIEAESPCDACGYPVKVLEAHGLGLNGLHFGLVHPKCAEFAIKIAHHYRPPSASTLI